MSQVRKDVLNGWKEIAAYLGRDPRTVERWEKSRSLPVRRLPGSGRATVYALVSELDAWLATPIRDPERQGPLALDAGEAPEDLGLPEAEPKDNLRPTIEPDTKRRHIFPLALRWAIAAVLLVLILCGSVIRLLGTHRRGNAAAAQAVHVLTPVPHSQVAGVEELYLRGCYQMELRTPESLHHAQDAFSGAFKRDPHYAPALAGLASTYILTREYSTVPDAEAYRQATDAATQAIALDPDVPQAHAVLGFVDFFWVWDAAAAEKQFQTALRLEPGLSLAHHWRGSMLTHEGRFRDGLQELNEAQRLEPGSAAVLTTRALALGLSGQRDESSELLNEAISTENTGAYRNPATMHHVMGMLSLITPRDVPRFLAEEMLAAELRQDTEAVEALHGASAVYIAKGERAMWQQLLADEQRRHRGSGPTYATARYQAELGSSDEALNELAVLFSRHDPALIGISVDPLLQSLHADPRFGRLRVAMGLPSIDSN